MTEAERKKYAKKVIKNMWGSSVSYSDKDLTPELCNWVIGIYLSCTSASKQIDGIENFKGTDPTTSVKSIVWKVIKCLRDLLRKNVTYNDWDPKVKIKAKTYKNYFQQPLSSGNTAHLPNPQNTYTGK